MSQPHRAREIGLGAVAILIGAALLVGSRGLGAIPGQNYGADTLPRLIAVLAIGTGIAMLIQCLRPKQGSEPDLGAIPDLGAKAGTPDSSGAASAGAGWIRDPRAWARLGTAFALVLGYALFSPLTGFIIAGFTIVAGYALLMGVRPVHAAILGIVAAVALRYAFADILLVPLPRLDLSGFGG